MGGQRGGQASNGGPCPPWNPFGAATGSAWAANKYFYLITNRISFSNPPSVCFVRARVRVGIKMRSVVIVGKYIAEWTAAHNVGFSPASSWSVVVVAAAVVRRR